MKKERSKDEFELGDLVMMRGHFGTVVKKTVEHCSSLGPKHDVSYEILYCENSQAMTAIAVPYGHLKLVQEAE